MEISLHHTTADMEANFPAQLSDLALITSLPFRADTTSAGETFQVFAARRW